MKQQAAAESFDDFAARHAVSLLGFARLLTRVELDAEDLTQDTLLRLFGKWEIVSRAANQHAYARQVMVNLLASQRRKRAHSTLPLEEHDDGTGGHENAVVDAIALRTALADLPDQQRTALVLRYYLHLSTPEIAVWMKLEESSVRSAISRGMSSLRHSRGTQDNDNGGSDGRVRAKP